MTRRPLARRRALTVAGFLLVLLVAELGARFMSQAAPDTAGWNVPRMAEHAAAMQRMEARGGVDVLVLGSSVVRSGIDADELAGAVDGYDSAYLLWVPGPPVESLEVLYRDLAEPMLGPRLVVLGVTSREFNDAGSGQDRQYQALMTSSELHRLAGRESLLQRLDRLASGYSAFIRMRGLLRDPGWVARELPDLRPGRPAGASEPADDEEADPTVADTDERERFELSPEHTEQERRALSGFSVGGEQLASLTRLVGEIRAGGAEVLLVNVPVDDSYVALHPGGQRDVRRYERLLAEFAEREGVAYLDAPDRLDWGREHFADQNHLNRHGRQRLTGLVAEQVRDLLDRSASAPAGG